MKYNRFGYLIGEGCSNVFKNKKSTGASLMIMCATMIIFGVFLMLSENINHFVDDIKSEQGFQVFLVTDATDEQIQQVGDKIRALEGVSTADFKTKEYAMNFMMEKLGDRGDLIEAYGSDYFPTSYIVTLTDLSLSEDVEDSIASKKREKRITSSNDTITALLRIANGVKIAIGVIFIILLFIAITIIANTIRLTVFARRKEISIMKYVGATNSFIRWPFVIEGMLIGLIAALLTLGLVAVLYDQVIIQIEASEILQQMGITLLQFVEIVESIAIVYVILGMFVGMLGSSISMKKYLEV